MIEKKNKRGQMGMLLVIGGLFVLMMLGIVLAIGSSVVNWTFDIAVPELSGLGMVGDSNMTEISGYTLDPVNTFVQNFTWVSGLIYVFGIIAIFGVAFAFRTSGDRWLVGLFLGLVLILIIGAIILSNVYQEIHDGSDDFASIMQEHIMLSYLILYSPAIFTLVSMIAGLILFSESGGSGV